MERALNVLESAGWFLTPRYVPQGFKVLSSGPRSIAASPFPPAENRADDIQLQPLVAVFRRRRFNLRVKTLLRKPEAMDCSKRRGTRASSVESKMRHKIGLRRL